MAAALVLGMPLDGSAGEFGPTQQKLPATGLNVELPTGWVARNEVFVVPGAPTGAPGVDLITRLVPKDPHMHMTAVSFGGHSCQEWHDQQPAATWAARPAFLPTGWHPQTERDRGGYPGSQESSVCLDTDTGLLIVSMEYVGSFDDPGARDFTPVLVNLARAAGVDSAPGAAAAAPPAPPSSVTTPPPATPVPAPTPAEPGISPSSAEPTPSPTEQPPTPAPTGDPGSEDDDDDDDDTPLLPGEIVLVELTLSSLQPDAPRSGAFGATLGIDASTIFDEEAIGLAIGYGLALGVNSDKNIPFDSRFGAGLGFRLGPVRLVPLVGVGMDTMGAGDAGSFKLDAALSYYVEGRLRLGLGHNALDGAVSHARRGSFDGTADRTPYENRIAGRFVFGLDELGLAAGVHYVDYVDADLFGGAIGVEFQ